MPADLYDHVTRTMRRRDDLFVYGVYAPCATLAVLVLALIRVGCWPVGWAIRRIWPHDDPHPINRWWTGW